MAPDVGNLFRSWRRAKTGLCTFVGARPLMGGTELVSLSPYRPPAEGRDKVYKATMDEEGFVKDLESGSTYKTPMKVCTPAPSILPP